MFCGRWDTPESCVPWLREPRHCNFGNGSHQSPGLFLLHVRPFSTLLIEVQISVLVLHTSSGLRMMETAFLIDAICYFRWKIMSFMVLYLEIPPQQMEVLLTEIFL
jgi:hypothetical protein